MTFCNLALRPLVDYKMVVGGENIAAALPIPDGVNYDYEQTVVSIDSNHVMPFGKQLAILKTIQEPVTNKSVQCTQPQ